MTAVDLTFKNTELKRLAGLILDRKNNNLKGHLYSTFKYLGSKTWLGTKMDLTPVGSYMN